MRRRQKTKLKTVTKNAKNSQGKIILFGLLILHIFAFLLRLAILKTMLEQPAKSQCGAYGLTFQNRVCLSGPNGFQKDHFVFINSKHVTMPKNPTSFFKKLEYKRAIICEETFQRKWKYGLFFEALRHGKRITSILWALSFTNQLSRFHRFTWPHIFFRYKIFGAKSRWI